MQYTIELELEDDGRWIADVPDIPGAMAYGATPEEAYENVLALTLRVADEARQFNANPCAWVK